MSKDMIITAEDARRFRTALLRAKLVQLGVVFDDRMSERTLERLVHRAETGIGNLMPVESPGSGPVTEGQSDGG